MSDLLDDYLAADRPKNEYKPAHIAYRILALALDYFFCASLILLIVGLLAGFDSREYLNFFEKLSPPFIEHKTFAFVNSFAWLAALINILYASIEALTGASVGKRILRLKIGSQDATTAPKSTYLSRALFKNLNIPISIGYLISHFPLFTYIEAIFYLVFFISCFFALGADRLALHDKLLGTAVYKKTDLDQAA